MNDFETQVQGKKVLVFGLGRQGGGQGDATWLHAHGAEVRVSDQDLTLVPGGQKQSDIDWADLIIKNPGVPDEHPHLLYAHSLHKPVLTSIAVFVKYSQIPVIGITGTRGKSTTTALISALLLKAYPNQVVTGGNIPGTSGLGLFDQEPGKKFAVLELSSFQLHNFHELKCSPHLAIITNLYPDHLNRYHDMTSYRRDKEAIVAYQNPSDFTLVNSDNAGALSIAKASTGTTIHFSGQDVEGWETSLPGEHNRENLAAMLAVAKVLKLDLALARQVAKDFPGLAFRQEVIRELHGVTYINDTTATTPTAAIKGIEAQTHSTILICGGASKKLPDEELVKAISNNPLIKHVILLGSLQIPDFVTALKQAAGSKIIAQLDTMSGAVALASSIAKPDTTVLLSPGFTSFDLFLNEFDRGRQFNDAVAKL